VSTHTPPHIWKSGPYRFSQYEVSTEESCTTVAGFPPKSDPKNDPIAEKTLSGCPTVGPDALPDFAQYSTPPVFVYPHSVFTALQKEYPLSRIVFSSRQLHPAGQSFGTGIGVMSVLFTATTRERFVTEPVATGMV
jgi:hypothetical protein